MYNYTSWHTTLTIVFQIFIISIYAICIYTYTYRDNIVIESNTSIIIFLYILYITFINHILYNVFSESAFSVIAPKSWNSLPYDIRCVKSISLFKRKLYVHFKSL